MLFIPSTLLIRHLWQLKTLVFLHWCLIGAFKMFNRDIDVNARKFKMKTYICVDILTTTLKVSPQEPPRTSALAPTWFYCH